VARGERTEAILQQAPPAAAAPPSQLERQREHCQHRHAEQHGQTELTTVVVDIPGQTSGKLASNRVPRRLARQRHRRSRIEGLPSGLGEPHLHPRVGVAGAHLVHAGNAVTGTGGVPGRDPRRHTLCSQHDRQRRRDLLAEPAPRVEQEVVDGVLAGIWPRRVQVIDDVASQPLLVGANDVIGRALPGGELVGQCDRLR
jgi:hypothetical protein